MSPQSPQTPGADEIHILQLYPRDMNIYGDYGNALVLSQRLRWYGYTPVMHSYDPGDELPDQVDLVIGGGGQDSGQDKIQQDLLTRADTLTRWAEEGVPMLVICGMYQLFGHHFDTREGSRITGIGILDVTTVGTDTRLIGNVVAESEEFGTIVGYENHSGQTTLGPQASPLARVTTGEGNNEQDPYEGARYQHVIGSYLHGSLLPKNPAIADYLLATAVRRRHGNDLPAIAAPSVAGAPLEQVTASARRTATARPR